MRAMILTILVLFLANMAFSKSESCPSARSFGEQELILQEAPGFLNGVEASLCLRRLIDREKSTQGLRRRSEKQFVADLLSTTVEDLSWRIHGP